MERVEFVSNKDRKHSRKVDYPTTMIELPIWTMVHQCNCRSHGKRWGGFRWPDINQYPSPLTWPQHISLCAFMQLGGKKLWRIKCNSEEQWIWFYFGQLWTFNPSFGLIICFSNACWTHFFASNVRLCHVKSQKCTC
jgi:hypothetical protein